MTDVSEAVVLEGYLSHRAQTAIRKHPNGQLKIKIKDVMTVYNHREELPLDLWRRAGIRTPKGVDTLVTPAAVQAAVNQDDGESVLEDIDTQWGTIPEGGALDYAGGGSD